MPSTLVYFDSSTTSHGDMLCIISDDKNVVHTWVNHHLAFILEMKNITPAGIYTNFSDEDLSSAKIEFFPKTKQVEIMDVILRLNNFYGGEMTEGEVLLEAPSFRLLGELFHN